MTEQRLRVVQAINTGVAHGLRPPVLEAVVDAALAALEVNECEILGCKGHEDVCGRCRGRGTYYAELPDSGDTAGTYVRCECQRGKP